MASKTVDFNQPVKNIEGNIEQGSTFTPILRHHLAMDNTKTDNARFGEWYGELISGTTLTLSEADKEVLKQWIDRNQAIPLYLVIQLKQLIDSSFKE